MKAQAIDDLIYVCEYIDSNKIRNEGHPQAAN